MKSKRALHETAKFAKITKISKFCRAFDEKRRRNANEVKEGGRQNRKNYENY